MEEYVCAFLDILGSKDKMDDEEFVVLIDKWFTDLKRPEGSRIVLRSFADTIVLAIKVEGDLPKRFLSVVGIVEYLSQRSFFEIHCLLRGGISNGLLYVGENTILGPALKRAYKIEKEEAIYPRIVIDEKTISDLKKCEDAEYKDTTESILRKDKDNRIYAWSALSCIVNEKGELHPFEKINEIFQEMIKGIEEPAIKQKYAWWANTVNIQLESMWFGERLTI